MTALDLISFVNQVLFVGLFLVVLRRAVRERTRTTLDIALLFGSIAAVVVIARLLPLLGLADAPLATPLQLLVLNLAPYAMLRLVDDFSGTPRGVQVAGGIAYLAVAALGFAFSVQPQLVEVVLILWFLTVGGYAAVSFAAESRRSRGITRQRMAAVATGAVLFICAIVLVLVGALVTGEGSPIGVIGQVAALGAVVAFFLGFAPPSFVRRAWREPDLRLFFERSFPLLGVTDDMRVVSELEQSAATALGATRADIGLSDGVHPVLRYANDSDTWVEMPDDAFIAGRAFQLQQRVVAHDAGAMDPSNAETYEQYDARTVIAAPMTTEGRRIGALAVSADRAPVFIDDDMWLLELLADHMAVLLEARELGRHASELQAREESARLKEEFLSAAAHDLRTPLTVVLGQAELLERRLARDPIRPVDIAGVSRMANEARRLRDLVSELLDAQRLEQPGVAMERQPMDLREVIDAARTRQAEQGRAIEVEAPATPITSSVDRTRIEQVLDNLIENALKYSTNGVLPRIRLWEEGGDARLAVIDQGVGIPEPERARIFDRFYRASNAQDITDTGMGLGLYICHRIVEEHGGRIWVESTPGGGSTFCVALPLARSADEPMASAAEPTWSGTANAEAAADA